jgi:amino acid transporter
VFVLAYFRVNVAAGVLTVLFLAEALVVLVIDIGIVAHEGGGAFTSVGIFTPSNVFVSGGLGIALVFAFSFFQGFEGTAIYAEEAKNPSRTVPRATYLAISCITVWYILTSWAFVVGGGGSEVVTTAMADPGGFAFALSDEYVSPVWTVLLEVLIVTSMFGGALAFHNAAIRYMFSLARDGFLPTALGRIHPVHRSPTVAGGVNAVLQLSVCLGFAIAGLDPLTSLSTSMTGLGAVGLLALVTTTSLSVAVYFRRAGKRDFAHVGLPVVGAIGVGLGLVLSLTNYSLMTGTDDPVVNGLPWLHVVIILVVILVSLRVRRAHPARWEQAGGDRAEQNRVGGDPRPEPRE